MPSLKAMAREAQNFPKSKGAVSKQNAGRKSTAVVFKSGLDSESESETESELSTESVSKPMKATLLANKLNRSKVLQVDEESDEDRQGEYLEDEGSDQEEEEKGDEAEKYQEGRGEQRRYTKNRLAGGHESDNQSTSSESGSSSGSETDQEEESASQKNTDTVITRPSHMIKEQQIQPVPPEPPAPYNPPKGFELISTNDEGRIKVADIFSSSNLAGKQLWYITAPASVPINSVKQVSLEDVQLGKPALSLNGQEYVFVQETIENRGRNSFLIPDKTQTAYRIAGKAIDQTLHLQQIVKINELSTNTVSQMANSQKSANNQSRSTIHGKRPARKQPKGLRMRYCPIGFGNGKPGAIGSNSSSSDASSGTDSDAS